MREKSKVEGETEKAEGVKRGRKEGWIQRRIWNIDTSRA